jgi:putative transposase
MVASRSECRQRQAQRSPDDHRINLQVPTKEREGEDAVEVTNTMGATELVRKYLESDAGSDLLAEMVKMAAELLMDADVDLLCNAGYGERSENRVNSRNGHRVRRWDTRAGTINLEIPKLRKGSYLPSLLEPRRRAEQALVSVVCQAYVEGVSTRRVDDLVRSMGIDGMSKSQVSELAKNLDARVAEFRNRPLDAGPYTYVWVDALFHKVREGGRVVSVATVIATGVNVEGHREILGVDVFTSEDGAGWTAFLRGLVARGLSGVALVISDAHEGLKNAIAAVLPGASWQRCRTHAMRNLLTRVPKAAQALVATLVRTIFAQSDATQVQAQFGRVVDQLESQFPRRPSSSSKPRATCSPSPASPSSTGARSGRTTTKSGLTKSSGGAPTSSGSSPTAPPSSAWPAPCSPSSTTSGPSPGAT